MLTSWNFNWKAYALLVGVQRFRKDLYKAIKLLPSKIMSCYPLFPVYTIVLQVKVIHK